MADVGTDHGFIPIELVRRGVAERAIAMDIGAGPLERARNHIRRQGLEEKIETRLGDGVQKLSFGEADTVIIAGMGGQLIIHIIENGRHLWDSVDHWILSPQSEIDKVRKYLYRQGFQVVKEDMVEDEGKYYVVMDAVFCGEEERGGQELTEMEYLYGPRLIEEKNQVLAEFLEKEKRQLLEIVGELGKQTGEKARTRREELEEKIQKINTIKFWR